MITPVPGATDPIIIGSLSAEIKKGKEKKGEELFHFDMFSIANL
jgi:hypothetical protein